MLNLYNKIIFIKLFITVFLFSFTYTSNNKLASLVNNIWVRNKVYQFIIKRKVL